MRNLNNDKNQKSKIRCSPKNFKTKHEKIFKNNLILLMDGGV